jgi:hypothetical protein
MNSTPASVALASLVREHKIIYRSIATNTFAQRRSSSDDRARQIIAPCSTAFFGEMGMPGLRIRQDVPEVSINSILPEFFVLGRSK